MTTFLPFSDLADPNIRRRTLPHWHVPGATYFITFRLADSLPSEILKQFEVTRAGWLKSHHITDRAQVRFLAEIAQREYRRLFTTQEERWLDAGHGRCELQKRQCRHAILQMMLLFDRKRYALDDFVIMPNHVHALIQPLGDSELISIVGSWKKFSARLINTALGRTGSLWQSEWFDHIVRDRDRLRRFREYIRQNPVKARLSSERYTLGRGSGIE